VRKDGFALPLMLAILGVGSLLVAAAFLMARLEAQSGQNGLHAARALEAAESGLAEVVTWWDPLLYNQLAVGGTLSVPARTFGTSGYDARLTRLSGALFQLEASGWHQPKANLPRARRTLRSLVRLPQEIPPVLAALTVMDSVVWDAGSVAVGWDTVPANWGGCLIDSAVAGLAAHPASAVDLSLCPGCPAGVPPVLRDSAISVAMLSGFGRGGYAGLAARAGMFPLGSIGTVAPRVSGSPSQCQISDTLNWGEPRRSGPFAACGSYFPVIHSPGDLVLTSGRGQGVLHAFRPRARRIRGGRRDVCAEPGAPRAAR
jgi:hypothetical protein